MKRRRAALFEQPSLVPMADMVTNTVGIMLFILIFVSLSAGGVVVARHLPRERHTDAKVIWMFCSHGRVVHFDALALAEEMARPLGAPTFDTALVWARNYSARKVETDQLLVDGQAIADINDGSSRTSVHIKKYINIRHKPNQGDDITAIKTPDSAFQRLMVQKSKTADFFFFFVTPDSIQLFRAARDQLAESGFGVGWSPLGPNEPARISLTGTGREATIQ